MTFEEEIKQSNFRSARQKASLNLLFTSNWLFNRHKDFFKKYDLTPQQYNVLRILRGQHPNAVSTSQIRDRMLDKNSDTSRIVDRLMLKDLVEKKVNFGDRRLVCVMISAKGLEKLKSMDNDTNQLDDALNITEEECELLSNLLDRIRE